MFYFYESPITILLLIISMIVVGSAHAYIKSNYSKYKLKKVASNLSGFEVARKILDENGLSNVHIVEVKGELTDHYDPSRKVVRLSSKNFHDSSIAATSIAAHEVGHALQDKDNYTFMKIRTSIVPVVNIVSYMGYFVFIFALIAGFTNYIMYAILMLLVTLLFQLVTLPVEFDASARAKKELERHNLVTSSELESVNTMLLSAALTYVAGVISSLINLLRLIIILNDRD